MGALRIGGCPGPKYRQTNGNVWHGGYRSLLISSVALVDPLGCMLSQCGNAFGVPRKCVAFNKNVGSKIAPFLGVVDFLLVQTLSERR